MPTVGDETVCEKCRSVSNNVFNATGSPMAMLQALQRRRRMPIQNGELKWVGVDFDGTIVKTSPPDYKLGEPINGAREALTQMANDGWKIVIFTARPWADYTLIEDWLKEYLIPFRRIICGKPLMRFYIDDRNIEFNGHNWGSVLATMRRTVWGR